MVMPDSGGDGVSYALLMLTPIQMYELFQFL